MTAAQETFVEKHKRLKREREAVERGQDVIADDGPTVSTDDPFYSRRASAYAHNALDSIVEELSRHPEGSRNEALNNSALRCYRWVLAGLLNVEDTTQALRNAAYECGLETQEIGATLQSAWRGANKYGPAMPELKDKADDPFAIDVDPVTGEVLDPDDLSSKVQTLFPRLDWHALWADDSEEEWIVEPILPARRLVALYSAPKLGKSLLMLEIAVGVALGRIVLGVTPDRPRKVLYIDFENDPKADIRQRLQDMGVGPDDLTNLYYLSFPTMASLDSERGGVELMAAVAEYECEVVVVDTVSRAIAGEENENDTWLSFYRHTGLRLKQAGVALVRLDHSGKDETKGQRGGSAKSGDVDAVWRLSRVNGETYRLDCEAARMPVAEKVLVLHREVMPLRHRVDAEGRSGAWRVKLEAAAAQLDGLGVPPGAGRDLARAALKAAGQRVSNEVLAEVVRVRQAKAGAVAWED